MDGLFTNSYLKDKPYKTVPYTRKEEKQLEGQQEFPLSSVVSSCKPHL